MPRVVWGLRFAVFTVMHLVSHYTLNSSYEQANTTMLTFRQVYQNPLFEVLLVVSLLAHMYSNSGLYMARSKIASNKKDDDNNKKAAPPGSTELNAHRFAGYLLSLLVFGHVFAVRVTPLLHLEDPSEYDYSFAASVYELIPFNIFPVYLSILGMVGGWHTIYGVRSAIATLSGGSVVGKPFPIALKAVALANHLLIIGAVVALGGYASTVDFSEKEDMHRALLTAMGM